MRSGISRLSGAMVEQCRAQGLGSFTVQTSAGSQNIQTDCLAVSGGWNPTVHLTCHMNGRPTWQLTSQALCPPRALSRDGRARGRAMGVFTTAACLRRVAARAHCAREAIGITTGRAVPCRRQRLMLSPLLGGAGQRAGMA